MAGIGARLSCYLHYGSPMSDWIAAITLLVSVVTLCYVVRTDRRDRKYSPAVNLDLSAEAELRESDSGNIVGRLWTLSNTGSADARISVFCSVNCEVVYNDEYRPIAVLKAGETKTFLLKPYHPDEAWALVAWSSPYENKWLTFEWFAPDYRSKLNDVLWEFHARFRKRRKWRRGIPFVLRRAVTKSKPVGPGGVLFTRVNMRQRTMSSDFERAVSLTGYKLNLPQPESGRSSDPVEGAS